MQNLKILNRKEINKILDLIDNQWNCRVDLDYAFLQSEKDKIYLINKEVSRIDLSKLRINSMGLYFGTLSKGELRLTIEGTQLIGKFAKKNFVELNGEEVKLFFSGQDLDKKGEEKGFVILKHKSDFLGCGKFINGKLLNYTPKVRRIV